MLEYHAAFYKYPEDDGWYVVSVLDFPGDERTIKYIDFKYRNLPGGGRAKVEVWGFRTDAPTAQPPTPSPSPDYTRVYPLTGLPASSDAEVRRPALSVKIDNAPSARSCP